MKIIDNKYSFGFLKKIVLQLVLDIGMKKNVVRMQRYRSDSYCIQLYIKYLVISCQYLFNIMYLKLDLNYMKF